MLKTERMNLEEAIACTTLMYSFKENTFNIESIKSAIEKYERSRLGDYDNEFMLILNKSAVTGIDSIFTTSEFIESYQATTKMDAIRNNYMGSIEISVNCKEDAMQLLECSLYFDFKKEHCELRAKVNGINGVNLEELRHQAREDVHLRKALNTLIEMGVLVPSKFETSETPLDDPFPG